MKYLVHIVAILFVVSLAGCRQMSREERLSMAESSFAEGRSLEDEKNYKQAAEHYLDILALMEDAEGEELRWTGKAKYRLGVVYRSQAMYEDALSMDWAALKDFALVADSTDMLHATRNMAREFSALKQYDSCKLYFDKCLILAELIHADNEKISILGEIGSQYYRKIGDYPNAIRYLKLSEELWQHADDKNKEFYSSVNDVVLAYLYFVSNDYGQAGRYAKKGLENEKVENRVTCYQILYEISKTRQDVDSTLFYADAFIDNLAENFTKEKSNSVQQLKNEFDLKMQAEQMRHSNMKRLMIIVVVFLVLIVAILLILWINNRKTFKRELELMEANNVILRNENRIRELTDHLNGIMQETERQKSIMAENTQRERLLSNRLLEANPVYRLAKSIENKDFSFKKVLEESDWDDFLVAGNSVYDDFFDRLHEQYPELSKWDLRTLCLLKQEFAAETIAYLLNIQTQSLKKRLYRMKYVKLSDARSLDEIMNENC